MLISAVLLFLITLSLGPANLISLLQHQVSPKWVVIIHGSMAITGLLLIFFHVLIIGHTPLLLASFGLLVLATLGGLTLLCFRLKHKRSPVLLIVLHPFVAIVGVILLTISLLP